LYVFKDKAYLGDYIGNVTWGSIMKNAGWPRRASLLGAGFNQSFQQDTGTQFSWWLTNGWNLGDDPRDSQAIKDGYGF
jgi:hypothetical protein